jgi:hypothetical protein
LGHQLSSARSLVEANQAAVQREQQRSLKALEVTQAELRGYREVHLSMVALYDEQMQQMREQLQSVLHYVLDVEESAKKAGDGDVGGSRVSARKVVDMMQLVMQQIHQQDLLIHAMAKQPRPSTAPSKPPTPSQPRIQPVKVLSLKERRRGAAAALEGAEADGDRLIAIPLNARISHLELQLAHTEQQLASQRQQAAQFASQTEKAREELRSVQQRLLELQRQLSHEKQQSKRREREVERQLKELNDARPSEEDWARVNLQLEESKAALTAATEELQAQVKLVEAAQQREAGLQQSSVLARVELEESERRLRLLQEAAQRRDDQLAAAEKEIDELRRAETRRTEEEAQRRAEADQSLNALRSLQDDLSRHQASTAAAQRAADEAVKEAAELRSQCQRMQVEEERYQAERERWRRSEQAMRREMEALEATSDAQTQHRSHASEAERLTHPCPSPSASVSLSVDRLGGVTEELKRAKAEAGPLTQPHQPLRPPLAPFP